MSGVHHCIQLLLVEVWSHYLFCPVWLWTMILPISTYWVTRITSVSHCTQLWW
jgi:hypothetical protein